MKNCIHVLMEGAPDNVDQKKLIGRVKSVEGVTDVDDFHLWSISVGKHALTAHIVVADITESMRVLTDVTKLIRDEFKIDHTTIQITDDTFDQKQTTHIEYETKTIAPIQGEEHHHEEEHDHDH